MEGTLVDIRAENSNAVVALTNIYNFLKTNDWNGSNWIGVGVSNFWTNSFSYTNVTIITNDLPQVTNTYDVDVQKAQGQAAAETVKGQLEEMVADAPTSIDIPMDPIGDSWTVNFSAGQNTFSLNFNPMRISWVADLASLIKRLIARAVVLALLIAMGKSLSANIRSSVSARQATAQPDAQILLPGALTGLALAAASAITLVLGAIPTFAVFVMRGYLATAFSNPYSGTSHGSVLQGLWLANQFLPLELIAIAPVNYYVFVMTQNTLFWTSCTAVRFIVG